MSNLGLLLTKTQQACTRIGRRPREWMLRTLLSQLRRRLEKGNAGFASTIFKPYPIPLSPYVNAQVQSSTSITNAWKIGFRTTSKNKNRPTVSATPISSPPAVSSANNKFPSNSCTMVKNIPCTNSRRSSLLTPYSRIVSMMRRPVNSGLLCIIYQCPRIRRSTLAGIMAHMWYFAISASAGTIATWCINKGRSLFRTRSRNLGRWSARRRGSSLIRLMDYNCSFNLRLYRFCSKRRSIAAAVPRTIPILWRLTKECMIKPFE